MKKKSAIHPADEIWGILKKFSDGMEEMKAERISTEKALQASRKEWDRKTAEIRAENKATEKALQASRKEWDRKTAEIRAENKATEKALQASRKEWDRKMAEEKAETKAALQASREEWDRKMAEEKAETKAALQASREEWDRKMAEEKAETKAALKSLREIVKSLGENVKSLRKEVEGFRKEAEGFRKEAEGFRKEAEGFRKEVKGFKKSLKEAKEMFTGQWGKLVEALVEGGLVRLLRKISIDVHHNLTNLKKDYGKQKFEFDIVSVNGKEVVVTEVKTVLNVKDVDYLIKKLDKFTEFAPEYKGRKIYGSVAYLRVTQSAHTYAEKKGLLVIRAVGDSARIINQKNFQPKAFS